MCTHLAKRGSRYYFRRRIPLALIAHFQRTEIVKALGTSNRSEAERLARLEGCRWDNEFARLQGEAIQVLPEYIIIQVTGPKLTDLYQQWLSCGEKAPKTRNLYLRAQERFFAIVGKEHVSVIGRAECRAFRDALKE